MLILDKPRKFDGVSINVPLYHRGHLSLSPGTKVWVCVLPGKKALRDQVPELVISPIDFNVWGDVWRISMSVRERRGVVNDVLELLKERRLNIIAAESSSMEEQRFHFVELIVDGRGYDYDQDESSETRSSREYFELTLLRKHIVLLFAKEISCLPSGEPRLMIRRVQSLFEARRDFFRASIAAEAGTKFKPAVDYEIARNHGKVELPNDVRKCLCQAFTEPLSLGRLASLTYLLVSETRDRFLRSYFFGEKTPVIPVTIKNNEKQGALAAISGAIRQRGFNILTCLARLYEFGKEGRSEFVLEPPDDLLGVSEKKCRDALKKVLGTHELEHDFEIEIAYPEKYGDPLKWKKIVEVASQPVQQTPPTDSSAFRLLETGETLYSRLQSLYKVCWDVVTYRRTVKDLGYRDAKRVLDLLDREFPMGSRGSGSVIHLFVSYRFRDEDALKRIKKRAKHVGFKEIIVGKKMGPFPTILEAIPSTMARCTHFLGVWNEKVSIKVGKQLWPSPWLIWELGVAQDKGLPWRLVISEQIDPRAWEPWKEREAYPYDPNDLHSFENAVSQALDVLIAEKPEKSGRRA